MINRYEKPVIAGIWSDEYKLKLWQETELAVILAKERLKRISEGIASKIRGILTITPIDLEWWKAREKEIGHDLQAFVEERRRHLEAVFAAHFHDEGMTSYDTEEAAFATMLKESVAVVQQHIAELKKVLGELALKHRHTVMNGRTHGQEAELQSFGKRVLTWLRELMVVEEELKLAAQNLHYSRLSGAVGNYGGNDPEVEREALKILGFEPFYGATQIMPRVLYVPLASALSNLVLVLGKIALDIRLGARSGRPIYQEPFGKKQKGSSAMPHKKNTITTEQIEGMGRMAADYADGIRRNITTWEERAIEQSCVERVFWPDLFHVTVHSLEGMIRIISGLRVYPDNMLWEVKESRGCYASAVAKDVLKKLAAPFGLTAEECYGIVQLAAFNVFQPSEEMLKIRRLYVSNLRIADGLLTVVEHMLPPSVVSIREVIMAGELRVSDELEADQSTVDRWNAVLKQIFVAPENVERWKRIFQPSYLLRNEGILFLKILGVK